MQFNVKMMKSLLKVGVIISAISGLTGCVFAPVCNQDGAYAQGVSDGQFRVPENYNYAATCPAHRGRINRAYHRGYVHGLHMRPAVAPVPVPVPVNPHPWHPRPWGPQPYHPGHSGHHGHHPHPPKPPRPPHPHHRHKIIPGVPTPPTQTHIIKVLPGVPTPPTHTHVIKPLPVHPVLTAVKK